MDFSFLVCKVVFWGLFATILGCIEIEAEGVNGWAEKLPTWYRTKGLPAKIYGRLLNGKPLTGYHSFMFVFPAFIFHTQFFMGTAWSVVNEIMAWAMYFVWCVMWDYHWFVLNPAYVGRFKKDQIWWHAKSYWVRNLFPIDYLGGVIISLGLAVVASWLSGTAEIFIDHFNLLFGFGIYTFLLFEFASSYHAWHHKMRLRDDRESAGIFHKK